MQSKENLTKFNYISDSWTRVKNHCRTTDNKEFTEKEATEKFKSKLLISEHSPIRLLEYDWTWSPIKYWVSTEWSRHKFEKFISTARDDRGFADRTKENGYTVFDAVSGDQIKYTPKSRDDAPQKNPVKFDGYANQQNLIDAWRKRLCFQATNDARELAEDFKCELHKTNPLEADVLVPNCIYRCGCPEFYPCGLWENFISNHKDENLLDINDRYAAYNKYFYNHQKERKCRKSENE